MDLVFLGKSSRMVSIINLITRLIDNLKKEIFFKENNEYIIAVEKALIDLNEAVEWLKESLRQ